VRLGPTIAKRRGWAAKNASMLLVVVDSRTNRRHVERLAATFHTSFPDRNVAVKRWLARPDARRPLHGLWFVTTESGAVVTQRVRNRRSVATHGAAPVL